MKFHGPYALRVDQDGKPTTNAIGDPLIFATGHRPNHSVAAYIVQHDEGEASIETELKRLKIRDDIQTAWMRDVIEALRPMAQLIDAEQTSNEIDVILVATQRLRMFALDEKEHGPFFAIENSDGELHANGFGDPYIFKTMVSHDNHSKHGRKIVPVVIVERDRICRMAKVDISAEIGKPWSANATFQGEGVKMFAAQVVEWFREQGGDNFVTVELSDPKNGQRFSLTVQREGGKTPAVALGELRRQLEELRGTHEQPIEDLCARLPNLRPELRAEIMAESLAQLQRRVLIQADWLGSYSRSFDSLDISPRIPGSGVQGARDPRNMRAIVEYMQQLLLDIYNTDMAAESELQTMGFGDVRSKFKHRIEDALGLPSTREKKS